jgi:hypothetical protein
LLIIAWLRGEIWSVREMKLDARCAMCERKLEDGGHLFFQCKFVGQLWRASFLEEHRCTLAGKQSAQAVIKEILRMKEEVQMGTSSSSVGGSCRWASHRPVFKSLRLRVYLSGDLFPEKKRLVRAVLPTAA